MKKNQSFLANVKYKSTEEGGRSGYVVSGYRPHLEFDNDTVRYTGQHTFLDEEKVYPGNSVQVNITMVSSVDVNKGDVFKIYEGEKIIGNGKIITLI